MAIPNTTPTPNELYNGEMPKMSDTELRIVLIVTRATLGWEEDPITKMRKQEDWLSYYQLKKRTGRGYTAIAKAINGCIKNKWVEARDDKGNVLKKKNDRIGKKIYYRLGRIFLDRITTSPESEEVKPTSSESEISQSEISECEAYKRNTITKEKTIQNKEETKKLTQEYINSNKRKDVRIILLYARAKGKEEWSATEESSFITRNVRPAKLLEPYPYERIMEVMKWLKENADFKWSLETIGKYIDEDLKVLKKTINKEEELEIPSYALKYVK